MITRNEIEAKVEEFDVHTSNVQRDYVFGWLLAGIYGHSSLRSRLVLKGGNCLRKAYFEHTRFSADLDFAVEGAITDDDLREQLNDVCRFVQEVAGVQFEVGRNRVQEKRRVDRDLRVWEARLYFKDFYGRPETITISVRLDVTQFERFWLPIQSRALIHPYSDASSCVATVQCMKLEEILASKLKCLIQRRHVADLYDYVHWLFFRAHDVDTQEVIGTFLKKTIYQSAPRAAYDLFINLPFTALGSLWQRFVVCPAGSVLSFDEVKERFLAHVEEAFAVFGGGAAWRELAYFPAKYRTPIMDAGASKKLLRLHYHGVDRLVEPYSLLYRVRKDGVGREYFYAYDQTGGRQSGPGLKTFVARDIDNLELTEQEFEPRFEIEVSKAGEFGDQVRFTQALGGRRTSRRIAGTFRGRHRTVYVIECSTCGKTFQRLRNSTRLKRHKDAQGYDCFGRSGWLRETR